jgi:hypothetical protein
MSFQWNFPLFGSFKVWAELEQILKNSIHERQI